MKTKLCKSGIISIGVTVCCLLLFGCATPDKAAVTRYRSLPPSQMTDANWAAISGVYHGTLAFIDQGQSGAAGFMRIRFELTGNATNPCIAYTENNKIVFAGPAFGSPIHSSTIATYWQGIRPRSAIGLSEEARYTIHGTDTIVLRRWMYNSQYTFFRFINGRVLMSYCRVNNGGVFETWLDRGEAPSGWIAQSPEIPPEIYAAWGYDQRKQGAVIAGVATLGGAYGYGMASAVGASSQQAALVGAQIATSVAYQGMTGEVAPGALPTPTPTPAPRRKGHRDEKIDQAEKNKKPDAREEQKNRQNDDKKREQQNKARELRRKLNSEL